MEGEREIPSGIFRTSTLLGRRNVKGHGMSSGGTERGIFWAFSRCGVGRMVDGGECMGDEEIGSSLALRTEGEIGYLRRSPEH